jgi:hypothetical protein
MVDVYVQADKSSEDINVYGVQKQEEKKEKKKNAVRNDMLFRKAEERENTSME